MNLKALNPEKALYQPKHFVWTIRSVRVGQKVWPVVCRLDEETINDNAMTTLGANRWLILGNVSVFVHLTDVNNILKNLSFHKKADGKNVCLLSANDLKQCQSPQCWNVTNAASWSNRVEQFDTDKYRSRCELYCVWFAVTVVDIITLRGSIVGQPDTLLRSLRETISLMMSRSNSNCRPRPGRRR